jgi:hypothetical protein
MLCSRFLFVISGAAFGWPLRSTVFRSSASDRLALSGMGALLTVALGVCAADLGSFAVEEVLATGVGRCAEEAAAAAPPLLGGATIRGDWRV